MRSLRSVLQVAAAVTISACAPALVAPVPAAAPAAPAPALATPAVAACADEAQAEKAYYEAQRLFQKGRYWEAAPGFVISYNFCRHAQVLCAAGQAYKRAGKCEKSVESLARCLDGDIPATARKQAQKLLTAAEGCGHAGEVVTLRGTEDATPEETEGDVFAIQPWSTAAGASDRAP